MRVKPDQLPRSAIPHGIQIGTIYALIALGYTMVYGIINSSILRMPTFS